MALDKSKSTIDYLQMTPADNGIIVSWTEKIKSPAAKGTFDNCQYKDHKLVFDDDVDEKGDSKDGLEEAFTKFKELWMRQYKDMKGSY